jgi:hypothetical protein
LEHLSVPNSKKINQVKSTEIAKLLGWVRKQVSKTSLN